MAGDSEWWRRYWAINCRPNLTIAMVRFPDGFLSGVKGNHMSDFTLSAGCGARGEGGRRFFVISQIEICEWWRSSVREEWSADAKWIKTDCGVRKKKLSQWWANKESEGHPRGRNERWVVVFLSDTKQQNKVKPWKWKSSVEKGLKLLRHNRHTWLLPRKAGETRLGTRF